MARRQLRELHQIDVDRALLDAAAALSPGRRLRSLDAIHLASALRLGITLRCVITYDSRISRLLTTSV